MITILFEPSYMQPYLTDIDATIDNTFSCVINSEGGTSVIAYQLELDGEAFTHAYSKVTLGTPLYNGNTLQIQVPSSTSQLINGNDYTWKLTLYESNPSMWVAYGVIQSATPSTTTTLYLRAHYNVKSGMYIKINNQTKKITAFNNTTGVATLESALTSAPSAGTTYNVYSDFLTSSDYYFKSRKTPTVSITNIPTTVTSRTYTFNGSYTQIDNVAWKYFKFILYNSNDEIVEQSDNINTGVITYTFDGLIDNTTYKIQLVVENQDSVVISTNKTSFNVDYQEPSLLTIPSTENLCSKNAVRLFWSQPMINLGVASNPSGGQTAPYYNLLTNEPYLGGSSVSIHDNCILSYIPANSIENVDIPYNSTVYIYCRLSVGFDGSVVDLLDEETNSYYNVSYSDGIFSYDINNEITGDIDLLDITKSWLFCNINNYNPSYNYVWDDIQLWNDNFILAEPTEAVLDNSWFKISLLPTETLITVSTPEHLDAFYEANTNMNYNTRLYTNTKLITTNVLYI